MIHFTHHEQHKVRGKHFLLLHRGGVLFVEQDGNIGMVVAESYGAAKLLIANLEETGTIIDKRVSIVELGVGTVEIHGVKVAIGRQIGAWWTDGINFFWGQFPVSRAAGPNSQGNRILNCGLEHV